MSPSPATIEVSLTENRWFREIKGGEWHILVMGNMAYIYHRGCACESAFNVTYTSMERCCMSCKAVLPRDLDSAVTLIGPYHRDEV